MAFVFLVHVVFFIDRYRAGVSNKYCLLSFISLSPGPDFIKHVQVRVWVRILPMPVIVCVFFLCVLCVFLQY